MPLGETKGQANKAPEGHLVHSQLAINTAGRWHERPEPRLWRAAPRPRV